MTFKQFTAAFLVGAATIGGVWAYGKYNHPDFFASVAPASSLFKTADYSVGTGSNSGPVNFEAAAAKASPAVVHIKILQRPRQQTFNPFSIDGFEGMSYNDDDDNGDNSQNNSNATPRQVGSGSGVAVSADGYIVTNNHVVEKADELIVTLNDKKNYKAKVIGTDPSSDLAVIKIEEKNLPYLSFANSDDVHVGQWVLAIGYPLNLETTVTSGIVSAKSRSIGINSRSSKTPIESFIQTDAAVNPGNSGGALVNTDGNLIGINSAIASPTGSYAGYSYAIPANLVARVASDIIKYGSAKRGYLGVLFGNDQMSDEDRQKNNIPDGNGVYVMDVAQGSAAAEAGIQKGDFITKINGSTINASNEIIERISSLRPGDKVAITYTRNGTENTTAAVLKSTAGNYPQQAPETDR